MLQIRPERPDDIPAVRKLNQRAFGRPDEGQLVDAVRHRTEPTISLVAVEHTSDSLPGQIVGHILFSPVTIGSADSGPRAIGLGPMAVDPDYQRRGVGSRLVEHGLGLSREAG